MTKCEKKILEFVEKHILIIGVILITAGAFLFRRQVIWFRTEDVDAYFDMHDHNVNTAFYYLCIRLLGYVSELPINGWKRLLSAADFAVALLCVSLCRREKGCDTGYERTRLLFLYGGCLLAPAIYIRGSVWGQPDSLAFVFLLAGCFLLKKQKFLPAVLLAGAGAALYPPCFLFAAVYLLAARFPWYLCPAAAAACLGIEILCGFGTDIMPWEAALRLVRFLGRNPITGEWYAGVGEWLWHMFLMGGYGAALVSGIAAFRRKTSYFTVILIHMTAAIGFSIALGWMAL